jgi:hypothetical protein
MLGGLAWNATAASSNEPDNSTPQQVFDGMRKNFHAEKAQGVHLRYAFQLSGPNGGEWFVEVSDGKCMRPAISRATPTRMATFIRISTT